MYLSRVTINQQYAEQSRLRALHNMVYGSMPNGTTHQPRQESSARLLYRVDYEPNGQALLLVQSAFHPDPTGFAAKVQSKMVNYAFASGQQLRFRLVAAPTVNRTSTGKRYSLTRESEQLDWLNRKGIDSGFSINAVQVTKSERVLCQGNGRHHSIEFVRVQFDGELTVTDAVKFQVAVESGIGAERAWGCGLLSVAGISG